jgi:hypothetical protein
VQELCEDPIGTVNAAMNRALLDQVTRAVWTKPLDRLGGVPHKALWRSAAMRPESRMHSCWQDSQNFSQSINDILHSQSGKNHAENTSDHVYPRYTEPSDNAHRK